MNRNKRAQAPKRTDRHTSLIIDKGRHTKHPKAPRYSRSEDRQVSLSGNYSRWEA